LAKLCTKVEDGIESLPEILLDFIRCDINFSPSQPFSHTYSMLMFAERKTPGRRIGKKATEENACGDRP
jgi:hypothetical protein